jgi:RNA polymerase sigma-70 factor (ECF subfamily)
MQGKIDFQAVYREFHPKILRYVSSMAGPHEAEDITQEVFEKVSRSLEGFEGRSKVSTWIYRIATNAALDRLKSPSRKRGVEGLESSEAAEAGERNVWTGQKKPRPDQALIRKEMNECIREFIERLPRDHKAVMVLSELEGFRNRDIADILGVSLDTVKIRLHRARAALKKELEKGCDFYRSEEDILSCDRKTLPITFKK